MTNQEAENKFLLRFSQLSNRAKVVLERFKLSQFESFYSFFIEQNKRIDFRQQRNCGPSVGKELNALINSIASFSDNQNQLSSKKQLQVSAETEKFFDSEFKQLSTRTKNILSSISANYFAGFNEKVIQNNSVFTSIKLRNCGVKSYIEILEFQKLIANIIKEIEPLNYPTGELDKDEKQLIQKKIDLRIELQFDRLFDALNNRTKNILINAGANNLQVFIENILKADVFDLSKFRNCGEKTRNEIIELQTKVFELLNSNTCEEKSTDFFKNLEIYLFEGNVLKPVDREIFNQYFSFIQKNETKSLQEIAVKFNLTKERVRQIAIRIPDKIKKIVFNVLANGKCEIDKYFQAEYFIIDKFTTDSININERTRFNSSFITFVLQYVNTRSYTFICFNDILRFYSGIFINNLIPFDFKKFYDYLLKFISSRRKKDVIIEIDTLIKEFGQPKNNNFPSKTDYLNVFDRKLILRILKLLIQAISDAENKIELGLDQIIIRRNTKKFKHEFIADILNEYKKPMHFNELHEEFLKRNIRVTSALSIHGMMQHYPEVFGLKGPGIYGLKEWGGYFGTIGDVAEKLLKERNRPMDKRELIQILSRELYVSKDSINTVLFNYELEKRFVKMKNNTVGLKEWLS